MKTKKLRCPFSGDTEARQVFEYKKPPNGEINFKDVIEKPYYREIWQFKLSRHYLSVHDMDLSGLYEGSYVDANYKDSSGIKKSFERIIKLPPENSDNFGRIENINVFINNRKNDKSSKKLLDVGSGLGVFPFGMKNKEWDCSSIDPDPRNVEHIRSLGINAHLGNFMDFSNQNFYNLITFNKVLEHVIDPIMFLKKSKNLLAPNGLVYIEIPDGEMAEIEGPEREEFFVDHYHIFSITSLSMMADIAGFETIQINRLQEPSTKFTIRAFLTPRKK